MKFLRDLNKSHLKRWSMNAGFGLSLAFIGMNSVNAQSYYNQDCTDCGVQARHSRRAECIGRACFKKEAHTHDAAMTSGEKPQYVVHNSHAFSDLHGEAKPDGQTYEIEFTGPAAKNLYDSLGSPEIQEEVTVRYGASDFLTSEKKLTADKDGRLQRHTLESLTAKAQASIKRGEHVTCLKIEKPILTVPNNYSVLTDGTITPKQSDDGKIITTPRYACYIYADKYGFFVGNKLSERTRKLMGKSSVTVSSFNLDDQSTQPLDKPTYKTTVVLKGDEGRKDNGRVDIQDEISKPRSTLAPFGYTVEVQKAELFIEDGIATELGSWLELSKKKLKGPRDNTRANDANDPDVDTRKESEKVSDALTVRQTTDYMVNNERVSIGYDIKIKLDPKTGKIIKN